MKPPTNTRPGLFPSDKAKVIIVVIIFFGLLLFVLCALLGFLFLLNRFHLPMLATQAPVTPTMFTPTPDCGSPTLVLGTTTFQIQTLAPGADGSLSVPSDTSGIAYWVDGTTPNYVFVLSPTPQNLSTMATITVGTIAKATWKNCSSATYSLSAPLQGSFNASALPDQSTYGITVFFETNLAGAAYVFKGKLTGEQK